MTDETRPTTPLRRIETSTAVPSYADVYINDQRIEPPPDMSDFRMTEIREGAPRRAVEPLPDAELWQDDRPKSSRAEVMCVVLVLVLFVMEVAQMLWLFTMVGDW